MKTCTAESLAGRVDARIVGDPNVSISDGAAFENARPGQLTFLASPKLLPKLADSNAAAVLIAPELAEKISSDAASTLLIVKDPQQAFFELLLFLRPPRARTDIGVSAAACVDSTATIGSGTDVHANANIGAEVVIGTGCEIHSGVVIGPGSRIGDNCVIHPNVVIYHDVILKNRVTIHANSVIGADGYGYRLHEGRHVKVPQLGGVVIENDVEVGACATIDRGAISDTIIGEGSKIDNQVQIAHNCVLGKHNLLVAQVGFAGSVTTGDYVVCAGQVGVADHVHLGDRSVFGSKAGVHKSAPADVNYHGIPAQPASDAIRQFMAVKQLPELRNQFKRLLAEAEELKQQLGLTDSNQAA